MPVSARRAVFTGIGALTPIGLDRASFWTSLREGRSGVKPLTAFNASGLPLRIAGQIDGFDAKKFVDKDQRKQLKVMARTIQLAVAAAQVALNDGQVKKEQLDPTRFGVEFGAGLIASELEELAPAAQISSDGQPGKVNLQKWGNQGLELVPPLWLLKYLPNMLACHVSIIHNAQGPNNSITETDVAGLLAVGEAYRILARDHADFFLVGGADSKLNPLSLTRHALFERLSRRNDTPTKACRPFDRQRDGLVPGEGGTVLVLEEREHARRRGARIEAELVGFGSAFDRDHSGAGLARAIRAALAEAGVGPEEIDHVNAQGFSDPECDVWEARGIHEVFGQRTPVFAVKSYLGNLGAGAGTTELAASILAMKEGVLPGTLNYDEPDPQCPINVTREARPITKAHFVKIAFTEMGQCAAVVCRKGE